MSNFEKILGALSRPKKAGELAEETGISKDRIYVDISSMRRRGLVTNTADGKYARIAQPKNGGTEGAPRPVSYKSRRGYTKKSAKEEVVATEKQSAAKTSIRDGLKNLIDQKTAQLTQLDLEVSKLTAEQLRLREQIAELEDIIKNALDVQATEEEAAA